jgi:hypothetical protein
VDVDVVVDVVVVLVVSVYEQEADLRTDVLRP